MPDQCPKCETPIERHPGEDYPPMCSDCMTEWALETLDLPDAPPA